MHIITNLYEINQGWNNAFTGCCDAEMEFIIELNPGDTDHEVDQIIINVDNTSLSTLEVTEIGSVPYTSTPGWYVSVPLTQTFVLTQGNQLSVKFNYCPGQAVSGLDTLQFYINCVNHTGGHIYIYEINMADIVGSYSNIIAESSAIFNDCQGVCDVKKDLLHFNNPVSVPLPVTCTLTTTCGFNFFIDGNAIDITDFQMPPGQSVLQISNPGCAVAAPCNFDFAFDFCGNVVNIPVTHDLAHCNTCGIDCRGITITTTPVSMPKYTYGPDYVYDPLTMTSNWGWNWLSGATPALIENTTYQELSYSASGTSNVSFYFTTNISASLFPPLINPGDHAC